jgi:hypothetical protein
MNDTNTIRDEDGEIIVSALCNDLNIFCYVGIILSLTSLAKYLATFRDSSFQL